MCESVVSFLASSPCVKMTKLIRDANSATNVHSEFLRRTVRPVISRKKCWKRIGRFVEEFDTLRVRIPGCRIPSRFYGRAKHSWAGEDKKKHCNKNDVHPEKHGVRQSVSISSITRIRPRSSRLPKFDRCWHHLRRKHRKDNVWWILGLESTC